MLRISQIRDSRGYTLKLEGKLLTPWLDEVRLACDQLSAEVPAPQLDLAAVSYVDDRGAKLLNELQAAGFVFTGCSPFVASLLGRVGD
jgi:hypothetical protein